MGDTVVKPFPPVLDSYIPAIRTDYMFMDEEQGSKHTIGGFWLSFKLSDLQDPKEIKSIHISLTRQTNSHSLLATKQGKAPGANPSESDVDQYKRFTRGVMILEFNPNDYSQVGYDPDVYPLGEGNEASKWRYNNVTKEAEVFIPFRFPSFAGVYKDPSRENFEISEAEYNSYYKVQIRFSALNPPPADNNGEEDPYNPKWFVHGRRPAVGQRLANHLTNESNIEYFSEWSTIGLVRLIAPRVFKNSIFNGDAYNSSMINLVGQYVPTNIAYMHPNDEYYYKEVSTGEGTPPEKVITGINPYWYLANGAKNDEEYLSSYQVKVYDVTNGSNTLVHSSEVLKPLATNQVNYNVPCYFEDSKKYKFDIDFTTANLYEEVVSEEVNVQYEMNSWNEQSIVDPPGEGVDSVIGKVSIPFNGAEDPENPHTYMSIPVGTVFTIRRGEDTDDFGYWPLLYKKEVTELNTKYVIFDDFTIESGVVYRYELIMTLPNKQNYRMELGPIISVFDHAFLTGEGTQLSVKFNPNISTYRRNVSDNIVNTIGGKYPYVTRNSYMDYRSFSLSGTIAYEMDLERQFASRNSIYGDQIDIYGTYFSNRFFNQQNDRVTQRKFRELVLDYLYSDQPKLFRSTPEGNILVRVTDVSLTPNQTTARMIYDFTCTVTEIGDATIPNYQLYKIQDFGDL